MIHLDNETGAQLANDTLLPAESAGLDSHIDRWVNGDIAWVIVGQSPNKKMRELGMYWPAFPLSDSRDNLRKVFADDVIERAYRINAVNVRHTSSPRGDVFYPGYGKKRIEKVLQRIDETLPANRQVVVLCCQPEIFEIVRVSLRAEYCIPNGHPVWTPHQFGRFLVSWCPHPSPRAKEGTKNFDLSLKGTSENRKALLGLLQPRAFRVGSTDLMSKRPQVSPSPISSHPRVL